MTQRHGIEARRRTSFIDTPRGIDRQELQTVKNPALADAKACGKAIIIGEHAVVYGARAVAVPLTEHCMTIQVRPSRRTSETSFVVQGRELPEHVRGVVDEAFTVLGLKKFGVHIEGQHSLPIGAGLGSSATLCIVVLRGIAAAAGVTITNEHLAVLGNTLERRFHGNPSGLDTAVVAMQTAIAFRRGQTPEPITISPIQASREYARWRFMLVDSGVRSSTLAMIKLAEPYFRGSVGERRVGEFEKIGMQTVAALSTGDQGAVADAMNHASVMLGAAGVVNKELHEIIDACKEAGALAAKPTGAGGGGSVIALLDHQQATAQVQALRLKLAGLNIFEVTLP